MGYTTSYRDSFLNELCAPDSAEMARVAEKLKVLKRDPSLDEFAICHDLFQLPAILERHARGGVDEAAAEAEAASKTTVLRFRRVEDPPEADRFRTCVPLFTDLKAAAHAGSEALFGAEAAGALVSEWAELGEGRRIEPGMFVAAVSGDSMDKLIPDRAWCLFRAPSRLEARPDRPRPRRVALRRPGRRLHGEGVPKREGLGRRRELPPHADRASDAEPEHRPPADRPDAGRRGGGAGDGGARGGRGVRQGPEGGASRDETSSGNVRYRL